MHPSPKQSEDEAEQRRVQSLLSMGTTDLEEAPSLGETLLPFLFAAMEACWIDAILIAIASIHLFSSQTLLMPLWAPFVLIAGSLWLFRHLERRSARVLATSTNHGGQSTLPGTSLFITLMSIVTLFVIWISVYAQTAFVLDPRWLLSMLNDILLLNLPAYHVFSLIVLSLYFCWRGIRLSYRELEPSQVFSALRLGMGVLLLVIVIRAGPANTADMTSDEVTLLLLIPIFLFLSLSAHALARVLFVRRTHPLGFIGNIDAQERAIISIIGILGLVLLLLAFVVDNIANPLFLANTHQIFVLLGQVYAGVINILAIVFVIVATPFFWLIAFLGTLFPPLLPPTQRNQTQPRSHLPKILPSEHLLPAVVLFLKFALPLLCIVAVAFLVVWALRRHRRVRIVRTRRFMELHESLWSWLLFWTQLQAILRALWQHFFPRRASQEETSTSLEESGEPTARSIREIYRAFLKRAAKQGYPRMKHETPYEFRERLDEKTPLAQPAIAVVTEAYTAVRYGDTAPDETEVARVQREWATLAQKWQMGVQQNGK